MSGEDVVIAGDDPSLDGVTAVLVQSEGGTRTLPGLDTLRGGGERLPRAGTFFVTDHLGTTRAVYKANSYLSFGNTRVYYPQLQSMHDYEPFGLELFPTEGTGNTHQFTGHERDTTTTGNDYMHARFYGASLGRFMRPDSGVDQWPDDPQSWNLYTYVGNNPVNRVDPDGTFWNVPDWLSQAGSVAAGFLPGLGEAQDLVGAVAGYDLVSGQDLSTSERVISGAAVALPFVGGSLINKVVKGGEKVVEAVQGTEKAASTITENAAKGAAHEAKVVENLKQTQTGVVQQVTVKTQSGVKTRLDAAGRDANSGAVKLTEAKSSPTAPLTKNQKAAHPEIAATGATVVGQGKPGFKGGTKIPPTEVDIIR